MAQRFLDGVQRVPALLLRDREVRLSSLDGLPELVQRFFPLRRVLFAFLNRGVELTNLVKEVLRGSLAFLALRLASCHVRDASFE